MKTLIVLLSLSATVNVFVGAGLLRADKSIQDMTKDRNTWRDLAIKQDTESLVQQETIKTSADTLVTCLNKFGLGK